MMRIRVLRDDIDKKVPDPLLIEAVVDGQVLSSRQCSEVEMFGEVRMVYRPDAPLADGTRVWIECWDAWIP